MIFCMRILKKIKIFLERSFMKKLLISALVLVGIHTGLCSSTVEKKGYHSPYSLDYCHHIMYNRIVANKRSTKEVVIMQQPNSARDRGIRTFNQTFSAKNTISRRGGAAQAYQRRNNSSQVSHLLQSVKNER